MKVVYLAFFLLLSTFLHSQVTFQNAFPNLNFNFPVEIQNTGVPGDDRLFVVEQGGTIKVFDNDANTNTSTTFLDIQNDVDFLSG
ncbi:MAG: glucose sorbosone dehydrogenase, partial [Bacteroidota bacterium]